MAVVFLSSTTRAIIMAKASTCWNRRFFKLIAIFISLGALSHVAVEGQKSSKVNYNP